MISWWRADIFVVVVDFGPRSFHCPKGCFHSRGSGGQTRRSQARGPATQCQRGEFVKKNTKIQTTKVQKCKNTQINHVDVQVSVEGEHHEKAVELLKAAPASVKLVVRYTPKVCFMFVCLFVCLIVAFVCLFDCCICLFVCLFVWSFSKNMKFSGAGRDGDEI